uniref:Integral membrane protein n=1 Tax=Streptomyces sp. NBC_00180 TaxID=2903632 RepID=A0AAU1IA23_9ACTN
MSGPSGPIGTGAREAGEVFGPRMTLFADVLSVGLATAVASPPLLTAPAALSTACAVLRGAREERPATAGRYFALLRRRMRAGDLAAGALVSAGVLLLAVDLALAGAGLPGAPLFAVPAAAIGACALVTGLRACARRESLTDWRAAVRGAARDSVRDVGGSGLVLLAVATAALCAWMMVPLAFLAPGPLALAVTAVDVRREGRHRQTGARRAEREFIP